LCFAPDGPILSLENDQPAEAIRIYDSLLLRGFQEQELTDYLEAVTLFNKGVALGNMGKREEEIQVYDDVVQRFGESQDLTLREQVAKALSYKTECLLDADQINEARDLLSTLEQDYLDSEELTPKPASYYAYFHSRFALIIRPEEGK
jgi:tetratricopeptide (TPR) repeat protein